MSSVVPLLVSLSPAVLLLFLLPHVSVTQHEERWSSQCHHNCSWKCLLFTLQWPGGFCQSLNKQSECRIPPSVNSWGIHGLWPIKAMRCCDCWRMFHSDVQELKVELDEHWPSFVKSRSNFMFWKDEWEKHGVCAACVEGMNSPLRYFQICLKLRAQFDFHKVLEDAGITPSCERPYKVAEVRSVLAPLLGDRHEIQCVTDDEGREVWFQVKIPLARNLTVGCDRHHGDAAVDGDHHGYAAAEGDHHGYAAADGDPAAGSDLKWAAPPPPPPPVGHPCPPHTPFFFFPIDHEQPRKPCR
ncbi:ribonuclease T2-like [Scomber japonicus]|uniref:ribonuclease T2-like n=1 Tax=Scomber japonicus TaxID=13676 RepID=UPI002305D4AB|nr:ribonuclease T2-like [Scomber japonicus]